MHACHQLLEFIHEMILISFNRLSQVFIDLSQIAEDGSFFSVGVVGFCNDDVSLTFEYFLKVGYELEIMNESELLSKGTLGLLSVNLIVG